MFQYEYMSNTLSIEVTVGGEAKMFMVSARNMDLFELGIVQAALLQCCVISVCVATIFPRREVRYTVTPDGERHPVS